MCFIDLEKAFDRTHGTPSRQQANPIHHHKNNRKYLPEKQNTSQN